MDQGTGTQIRLRRVIDSEIACFRALGSVLDSKMREERERVGER